MAREPSILESTAARPITRMMLWFTNLRTSPTQYLGLRYEEDDGRPTLRLLHPDGAQVTTPFGTHAALRYEEDDGRPTLRLLHPDGAQVTTPFGTHAALVLCAVRLQDELLKRGWWLSPEPTDTDAPES